MLAPKGTQTKKTRGSAGGFPLGAYSLYFGVVDFFFRLRIQRATPTIAMIMTIGMPTTIASVDADETAIGFVTCD